MLDFILHLDVHLAELATSMGPWLYALLFLIVFLETGLVLTPFLPGDSLLFAIGALCALPGARLDIWVVIALLMVAAWIGDFVNYRVAQTMGPRLIAWSAGRFIRQEHLDSTATFFQRHGGKAVFLARFFPILRTYAPFVAGAAKMDLRRFMLFNFFGGFSWVLCFCLVGYLFGNLPWIKERFHLFVVGIILVSLLPLVLRQVSVLRARRARTG